MSLYKQSIAIYSHCSDYNQPLYLAHVFSQGSLAKVVKYSLSTDELCGITELPQNHAAGQQLTFTAHWSLEGK